MKFFENFVSTCAVLLGVSVVAGELSTIAFADTAMVKVNLELFPAGSFTAEFQPLEGRGSKVADEYSAKELKVAVKSAKTGFELRDKHLLETLESGKFPFVIVNDVTAKDGKGTAKITIKGVRKGIDFSYRELSKNLAEASFKLKLSDFKISGISYQGLGVEGEIELVATVPYDEPVKGL